MIHDNGGHALELLRVTATGGVAAGAEDARVSAKYEPLAMGVILMFNAIIGLLLSNLHVSSAHPQNGERAVSWHQILHPEGLYNDHWCT